MNTSNKLELSLFNFLKEQLKEYKVLGEKLSFILGYLKDESAEDRINGLKEEKKIPFLMLRRGEFKQKIQSGKTEKEQTYQIVLVIEEKDMEKGYLEIQDLADEVINLLTINPSLGIGYSLKQDEFSGGINDNLCAGNYWTYEIKIKIIIPVESPGIIERLGW